MIEKLILLILIIGAVAALFHSHKRRRIKKRERLIDTYTFPDQLPNKIQLIYPHLNTEQTNTVIRGLRDYFHVCNIAGDRMVSMPSQAVDVAWHEFILYTRKYEHFCHKALGRFLHHTPAEAMSSPTLAQEGIKTAWKIACFRENLPTESPTKLPRLFAIDKELNIQDGFHYSLDCHQKGNTNSKKNEYCAGHIGCGSGCGGGCSGSTDCGGGCGGD